MDIMILIKCTACIIGMISLVFVEKEEMPI
jgi:hypothetical protein